MTSVLFDLDGVFYQANQPIPGAVDVLSWVEEQRIPHLFVTNTSSRPRSALRDKFLNFGIQTDEDHIFTPSRAAVQWLKENINNSPVALFVPEATQIEFNDLNLWQAGDADPAAIVIGDLGKNWDFKTLNQAFRLLMTESRPRLIALGMTRYWQAEDGLQLDVAPFVVALQHAAGVSPLVMGKPAKLFYQAALKILGVKAEQTIMLGDDIRGDIEGAQQAGLEAILVRTGKFRSVDLEQGIQPDAVIDSIRDFPEWWQKNIKTG
ncbi:MAG: TIGR01458 family HAD-type hydrolase [Gammaproteobacteria bacterium]|nr:TIGR01458 family HAD-type hydrolase [Gammaproteobacteria bacterium]MCW9006174.1 TIGR01458 family HAD-type hydrolase [Gammaproteobacteria bacterium]